MATEPTLREPPPPVADASRPGPRLATALSLGLVYLAWGGTYPAIKVVVRAVPPLIAMGVRFLVAGLVLYAALAVRRRRLLLPAPPARQATSALIGVWLLADIGLIAIASFLRRPPPELEVIPLVHSTAWRSSAHAPSATAGGSSSRTA